MSFVSFESCTMQSKERIGKFVNSLNTKVCQFEVSAKLRKSEDAWKKETRKVTAKKNDD